MKLTEKKLWQNLKKEFKNSHIKLTRIESSTVSGIPDIAFTDGKINGWIELKALDLYARGNRPLTYKNLGLTGPQFSWFSTHPDSWVLIALKQRNSYCMFNYSNFISANSHTTLNLFGFIEKQGFFVSKKPETFKELVRGMITSLP